MTGDSELWQQITGLPIKRVEYVDGGVHLSTTDEDETPVWPRWTFSAGGAQLAVVSDGNVAVQGEPTE